VTDLRFGVIGAGQISQYACGSINSHAQAKVVAAHDPNADRLAELAKAHGIARTHAQAEALFADPGIDAVYIAVPNKYHAPLAKQALQAGKHVILDKPFALSTAEALEVAAAAKAAGKTFTLGMNQRFNAGSQKVRSLVEQGTLGEVYHAKAYWFRRSGIPKLGTWFGNKQLAGGGALLDIGVHLLDLALWTIGNFEPVAVSGATYTKFGNRGLGEGGWGKSERDPNLVFDVDVFSSALIKLKNGATVTLDVSWACHQADGNRQDVQLFGTEAGASCYPAKLYKPTAKGEYQVVENFDAPVRFAHCERFHNFINSLLGTEPLMTTIEQALAVQRILDAIYESSRTGSEVRIAPATTTVAASR
jgi:predicted dehydrogenase